jgi:hypothetical protein
MKVIAVLPGKSESGHLADLAWLAQLLTKPEGGWKNFAELFRQLTRDRRAIQVCCEVAD